MFIWIGIDVDNQLTDIKNEAIKIENALNFKNSYFTLPLHISLKMPFKIDDIIFDDVIKTIIDYYSSLKPFDTYIKGLEKDDCIIWIRMINNEFIDKICYDLNHILMEKYNIGLHEYDLDYKFHTTLFIDDNTEKIDKAFDLIKDTNIPKKLLINRFVIGTSETGDFGTYSIYKIIQL